MSKLKKYLLIAGGVIVIVIIAVVLANSGNETPATLKLTTAQINKDDAKKPVVMGNSLYYVSEQTLISVNLGSKEKKTLYKASGEILDFYLSPLADKAVVAVQIKDEPHNYLVEFALGKSTEIEQCLAEALNWSSEDDLVGNCVSQKLDYDPNIINDIISTDPFGKNQHKIVDLKFEPPKKLFIDSAQSFTILSASSGYKSNDLYTLDTNTQNIEKLTSDGFISDAVQIEHNLYLVLSSKNTTENEIILVNKSDKSTKNISNLSSLDQISAKSGNFASLLVTDGKYSVNISKLSSPDKIIKSYSLEEFDVINKIIYTENSIIIFTPSGIDQLTNI